SSHAILLWDAQDPPPGGPGIGSFSLLDPQDPSRARTAGARALLQLHQQGPTAWMLGVVQELVSAGVGTDVLPYLDLFFSHELDVELRLALIGLLIDLRRPGLREEKFHGKSLHTVRFSEWLEQYIAGDALVMRQRLEAAKPHWEWAATMLELAEGNLDAALGGHPFLRSLLADETEEATLTLGRELERVLREIPPAVARMEAGNLRIWIDPLAHFGPDFALLGSLSAYEALGLLAAVFAEPQDAVLYRGQRGLSGQLHQLLQQQVAADPRLQLRTLPAAPTRRVALRIWTAEALQFSIRAQEVLTGPGLSGLPGPFRLVLERSTELAEEDPFGSQLFCGTILDAVGQVDIGFPHSGGWPVSVDARLKAALAAENWEDAGRLLLWGLLSQLAGMNSLGPQAVRQLRRLAAMAEPEQAGAELSEHLRYTLVDLPEGDVLGAERRARSAFLTLQAAGWPE
ncbi:MAG TPA: hypothetical protein PLA94_07650, partial [Myxococcota bacterium]|nr:hypothetical protein [Myxococcota bacterium]